MPNNVTRLMSLQKAEIRASKAHTQVLKVCVRCDKLYKKSKEDVKPLFEFWREWADDLTITELRYRPFQFVLVKRRGEKNSTLYQPCRPDAEWIRLLRETALAIEERIDAEAQVKSLLREQRKKM